MTSRSKEGAEKKGTVKTVNATHSKTAHKSGNGRGPNQHKTLKIDIKDFIDDPDDPVNLSRLISQRQ